ncbi:MAG: M48 family metallopeptidase [Acidobacteriota bacterium]
MTKSERFAPEYTLRVSGKARNVRLVVAPGTGLTVVVPKGFDPAEVPAIVARRADWVLGHLERLRGLGLDAPRQEPPPALIELRYRTGPGKTVRVAGDGPGGVSVAGAIADRELVARGLKTWLKRKASQALPAWLSEESARLGLPCGPASVRLQRSRWGSCSAVGGISLNARLLFLPRELAGYVLVHELAHTVHLNHSPEYWRFLEGLLPGAKALDRALRSARRYVPAWANG